MRIERWALLLFGAATVGCNLILGIGDHTPGPENSASEDATTTGDATAPGESGPDAGDGRADVSDATVLSKDGSHEASDGSDEGACTPGTTQCSGNGVQTCDPSGALGMPAACTSGTCMAGACTGACASGATQCSGNGVQMCTSSGMWGSMVLPCKNQACVVGACSGLCTPGATQCSGNGVQTCSSTGTWSTAVACANQACVMGACSGICSPGATRCSGNGVQTCDATGAWGPGVACMSQACAAGMCSGTCTPGSMQCSGNSVQTCTSSGTLGSPVPCMNSACVNGACVGSCVPAALRCSGNVVQTCSANGVFGNTQTCTGQTCSGGACIGVCTQGAVGCNGSQPQTCNASGVLVANGAACSGCSACQAGACVPATGTPCNDMNACTQTDTCQNGTCVGSPIGCGTPPTCRGAGTCSPSTGMCTFPIQTDNTACNGASNVCCGGACTPLGTHTNCSACGVGCNAPNTCGGGGTANQCGCTSEPDAILCAKAGLACGTATLTDHCGVSRGRTCGTCPVPDANSGPGACTSTCTNNICVCPGFADGFTCGPGGAVITCGGICTNAQKDNANCGGCGNVCGQNVGGPGDTCDGAGVPNKCDQCPAGQAACDNSDGSPGCGTSPTCCLATSQCQVTAPGDPCNMGCMNVLTGACKDTGVPIPDGTSCGTNKLCCGGTCTSKGTLQSCN